MPHYTTWDDGSYTVIAQAVGGTWLCVWFIISSLFGNLGLYVAEMSKDGFQLAGMADSGLAPPFFAQYVGLVLLRCRSLACTDRCISVCRRDPERGVPRRAILLSFSIIVFMGLFDFDTILGVDNFLSALSSLVEMGAAVRMRFSHPEIERPYRVNLSDRMLAVVMLLPFCVGLFIMWNELTKSMISLWLNVLVLVLGVGFQKWIEKYPYHQYDAIIDTSPRHNKDLTIDY